VWSYFDGGDRPVQGAQLGTLNAGALAPGTYSVRIVVVDASGKTLGRLAVRIANLLRGRGKPLYTPHVDAGDFVVVVVARGEGDAVAQAEAVDRFFTFRNNLRVWGVQKRSAVMARLNAFLTGEQTKRFDLSRYQPMR